MFIAMSIDQFGGPRLLRPVSPPLGSYLRVGREHRVLQALLAEQRADFSGAVFDPWTGDRHTELRAELRRAGLETVLDTKAFEMSTLRGPLDARIKPLAWARELPHFPTLLRGTRGTYLVEAIADEVARRGYSAVLAPTHYLADMDTDEWLDVDAALAGRLRAALDERGQHDVCIYYPLIVHSKVFGDPRDRQDILTALADAPIDGLWLRVHPFSASTAGPLALRRYIDAARDLQRLGVPLTGEHTGTAGVAMLAFGAVGGIESAITYGERFDALTLFKAPNPNDKPRALAPRVYLHNLGIFVSRDQAQALYAKPGLRTQLGCRDSDCCRRGITDTTLDPRRHFVVQRQREVADISRRPEPVRPGHYLEDFLRPATDLALRASRVDPSLQHAQARLEGWRLALGRLHRDGMPANSALAPQGKRTQPNLRKSA